MIVLDGPSAQSATEEVLRIHSIPSMVSKDMQDLLGSGSAPAAEPQPAAVGADVEVEVEELAVAE